MALIEVPDLSFEGWRSWQHRDRPSQDFEVPKGFGILGIYVLAMSAGGPAGGQPSLNSGDLPEAIVYIGMSTHVDRRLELWHEAVSRYRVVFEDPQCANLWYSRGYSEWHYKRHSPAANVIPLATIAVYERALIRAYAVTRGRLPRLNRE